MGVHKVFDVTPSVIVRVFSHVRVSPKLSVFTEFSDCLDGTKIDCSKGLGG